MKQIDGKAVSLAVKERVRDEVTELSKGKAQPCLAVIIVGNDPASRVYVNNKKKACEFCGIKSLEFSLPEETGQDELLSLIEKLNSDESVNGILCQLPLPDHINEKTVIETISPEKDVDCFSAVNTGKLWLGRSSFKPCTPAGIIELFDYYGIDLCGKNCVVIGRSNIVGKPMAAMLIERNATVTVCHSRTVDLKGLCKSADVIVAAIGKAKYIGSDFVRSGAVVIDVGMNRDENGKLCGDVDYENVKDKCSFITPVPGGVGPMTIAILMENTLTAFKNQI